MLQVDWPREASKCGRKTNATTCCRDPSPSHETLSVSGFGGCDGDDATVGGAAGLSCGAADVGGGGAAVDGATSWVA